jgi:serine/threonine protein kinase
MSEFDNRRLGDFEIVAELGRGGMGVVYEAIQTSLGRRVALKVLGGTLGLTPKAVDRFRREAAAAAKLHHTNIVPVYATGEETGTHFYAMELVEGPSLDRVLKQLRESGGDRPATASKSHTSQPAVSAPGSQVTTAYEGGPEAVEPTGLSASSLAGSGGHYFDQVARMTAGVADALDYAHSQGVVHRDIKPANLLVSSDGRLSLNDFGLARMLEEPGMTMTGEFVGTPAYMSPEQITAGRVPTDHRTDIYSFGATLYELLTFCPPFSGVGRDQVLAQILQKDPTPPRKLNPRVPVDLETICLKCMEKDPDRRYATAGALADDLRRYVNRFAIRAKRAGPIERLAKWVRRQPGVAALLLVLFMAVLAAGGFALQARRAAQLVQERDRQAAVEKAIVEAMSGEAEPALKAVLDAERLGAAPGQLNMLRGLVELHRGRPKEAIAYLESAEKQWPDSVAVKALLATAYAGDFQYQAYDDTSLIVDRMEPQTPEDFIFLGQSQSMFDPRRGLETLDRAPAFARRSPIGRLVRAMIQTMYAGMTGKRPDVDRALEDCDRADLPDNPLLLNTKMQALLAGHLIVTGNDRPAKDDYLHAAGEVDEQLARQPDVAVAIQGRWFFYYVTGDDKTALRVIQEGKRRVERSGIFDYEYDILYRRRQYAEALKAVQNGHLSNEMRRWYQEVLYATAGQTEQAEQLFREERKFTKGGANLAILPAYVYLLKPGAPMDARALARDILDKTPNLIPGWRDGWYRDVLKYNAGMLGEAEFAEKAKASRWNQCEGCFYIGVRKLHEKDRAAAKPWFQKSVAAGQFVFGEYMWSKAFLALIDDPNWLPWCPMKK